jgi:hypothetical protein
MRSAHDDVERNASRGKAAPAVGDELNVTERFVEARAAAGLPSTEHVAEPMRAGHDLRAELQCMQAIVVARNAHGGYAKLSKRTRDAMPANLRVAGEVANEEQQVVSTAVEESYVFIVPKQMNITDYTDRGRLRGTVVHGTELSRRGATREREETIR